MAKVIRFPALNPQVNHELNAHMFHMVKANIGFCLMKMAVLEPDKKFAYIQQIDNLMIHMDLDNGSFKQLIAKELDLIQFDCEKELSRHSSLNSVVGALFKHFNLGGLQ